MLEHDNIWQRSCNAFDLFQQWPCGNTCLWQSKHVETCWIYLTLLEHHRDLSVSWYLGFAESHFEAAWLTWHLDSSWVLKASGLVDNSVWHQMSGMDLAWNFCLRPDDDPEEAVENLMNRRILMTWTHMNTQTSRHWCLLISTQGSEEACAKR